MFMVPLQNTVSQMLWLYFKLIFTAQAYLIGEFQKI